MISEVNFANALDKNGFCILPLISRKHVERLKNLYQDNILQADVDSGAATQGTASKKISAEILGILKEELDKSFSNHQYFTAHFLVNKSGEQSGQALHQNWNITNERISDSYQVLIPLDTFYPYSGGKFLVQGSHRFFQNYRSGSFGIPIVPTDNISKNLSTPVSLIAGDGLVYNNALFHGSFVNKTSNDSVSVIVYCLPCKASAFYFHKNPANQVCEQYSISADLLFEHLVELKQGKIPASFGPAKQTEPAPSENVTINSASLKAAFAKYWGASGIGPEIKMLHIAKEQSLEWKLDNNGYEILDFASEEVITSLRNYFFRQFGEENFEPGMLITINDMPFQRKREIHEFFCTTLKGSLDLFFKDYITPVSSYFTKNPSTLTSFLPIHTDSNLVLNPQLEPHYALWIPLQDVDENNGAVTVVKNSHRFPAYIAAPTIPWPFFEHQEFLANNMEVLKLKAGQAIVFDNRLIHCSTPNKTNQIRIGISIRLTHFLTPYYSFYVANNSKIIDIYFEQHDFYLAEKWRNTDREPLTGYKAGEIVLSPYSRTKAELLEVIES